MAKHLPLTHSAIYEGDVFHARHHPKKHAFRYRVFMMYLSLSELPEFLNLSPWWSIKRWRPARFKREDFHGDASLPLDEAVKNTVEQQLGFRPDGDVRMLANLCYFGYTMNPLVTYYCFDRHEQLVAVLAEVNNTPWGEKHAYALRAGDQPLLEQHFAKAFTVSPFNGLNMDYCWQSNTPEKNLFIDIQVACENKNIVSAHLNLQRQPLTAPAINKILIKYPLHTVKVISAIYWQALKLFVKRVPFLGKNKNIVMLEQH